jgi:hypothetical protein
MEPSDAARRLVKEQYATMRHALTLLDERVLARYWNQGTPVRTGFDRFLASMDEAAARLIGEETAEPARTAEPEGTAEPETVGVTFTLPADVEADRVALCGEFNDWATDETWLERDGDRIWRVTVALEPGRSYRYRYLLDGERWENASDADRYEPNGFGSVDSVVVVG